MEDTQRRRFTRIRFQSSARLSTSTTSCSCEVCDLSLKGAMVDLLAETAVEAGDECVLEIRLDEGDAVVRMHGTVAHREKDRIGMTCREIDLDSITHLGRLIELNLGDAQLLHRELSGLLQH